MSHYRRDEHFEPGFKSLDLVAFGYLRLALVEAVPTMWAALVSWVLSPRTGSYLQK